MGAMGARCCWGESRKGGLPSLNPSSCMSGAAMPIVCRLERATSKLKAELVGP